MYSKIVCLFVFLQLCVNINCQTKSCPAKRFEDADSAFEIITFFGNAKLIYPTTENGIQEQCKFLLKTNKELINFSKECLSAFVRQTIGLLLRGVNKQLKEYCSVAQRKNFLNYNKCGNAARKPNKKCMDVFTKEMKQISLADKNLRLPFVCCAVYNFHDCLYSEMSANPSCEKASVNAYLSLAKGYTEETKSIVCGGVEPGSEKCEEAKKAFKILPVNSIKSKSVLLPFLEISREF